MTTVQTKVDNDVSHKMTLETLPEPFLGRIIVEVLVESMDEFKRKKAGLDKLQDQTFASQFVLVDAPGSDNRATVPHKKGRIVKMAPDAFGECYKRKYGQDAGRAEVGDTVWFVPMQTYKLDDENKYHLIGDEDILCYQRGSKNV